MPYKSQYLTQPGPLLPSLDDDDTNQEENYPNKHSWVPLQAPLLPQIDLPTRRSHLGQPPGWLEADQIYFKLFDIDWCPKKLIEMIWSRAWASRQYDFYDYGRILTLAYHMHRVAKELPRWSCFCGSNPSQPSCYATEGNLARWQENFHTIQRFLDGAADRIRPPGGFPRWRTEWQQQKARLRRKRADDDFVRSRKEQGTWTSELEGENLQRLAHEEEINNARTERRRAEREFFEIRFVQSLMSYGPSGFWNVSDRLGKTETEHDEFMQSSAGTSLMLPKYVERPEDQKLEVRKDFHDYCWEYVAGDDIHRPKYLSALSQATP